MNKQLATILTTIIGLPKNLKKVTIKHGVPLRDINLFSKFFSELALYRNLVSEDIYTETLGNLEAHIIEQLQLKKPRNVEEILQELGTAQQIFADYSDGKILSRRQIVLNSIIAILGNIAKVLCYIMLVIAIALGVFGGYGIVKQLIGSGLNVHNPSDLLRVYTIPLLEIGVGLLLGLLAYTGIESKKSSSTLLISVVGIAVAAGALIFVMLGKVFTVEYLDTAKLNQTMTLTIPKTGVKTIALGLPDANTSVTIIEEDSSHFNTPNDVIVEATTYQQQSPSWLETGTHSRISPMQEDLWVEGKLVTYYYWNTDNEYVLSLDGWYNLPITDITIRVPQNEFTYRIEGANTENTFFPAATWYMDLTNKIDIREHVYLKNLPMSKIVRGNNVQDFCVTMGNEESQECKVVGLTVDGPLILTLGHNKN